MESLGNFFLFIISLRIYIYKIFIYFFFTFIVTLSRQFSINVVPYLNNFSFVSARPLDFAYILPHQINTYIFFFLIIIISYRMQYSYLQNYLFLFFLHIFCFNMLNFHHIDLTDCALSFNDLIAHVSFIDIKTKLKK